MVKVEILEQKGHKFLWIDDRLWMFDIPLEQELQKDIADKCFGEVLIAGYGLGVIQRYLSDNPKVTSFKSVELLPEVVEAAQRAYGRLYGEIEIGDFFRLNSKPYDCVVGDIWPDIVPQCLGNYVKFRDKARELAKPSGLILAWGQEFFEYLLATNRQRGRSIGQ